MSCLHVMKDSKAVGMDEVPVEFYRAVPAARHELFELIRIFYRLEFVPAEELLGAMLNFYKGPGKGSSEDHSAYRPIELLNHS